MIREALMQDFAGVAARVYESDPFWLGEDPAQMAQQIAGYEQLPGRKVWLRCLPGQVRLAVFFHPGQEVEGQPTAFFGFWEGVNNPALHQAIFAEAEAWAREQGAARMLGPINVSTFNPYRVRLNHFEEGQFPGEPYNPPYYADLLKSLGYSVTRRFHSWLGPIDGRSAAMSKVLEPARLALESEGITFSALSGDTWLSRLDEFYRYVDQIFGNNYAYTGISEAQFRAGFGEPIARKLCPHGSVLAQNDNGEIAGFFLGFPDYGPLLRSSNPDRKTMSNIRYEDFEAYTGRRVLLGKTGGVHPAFREKGLFGVMSYLMMTSGSVRYDWAGAVMVREDNPSARVGQLAFSRPDDQQRDYALFGRLL